MVKLEAEQVLTLFMNTLDFKTRTWLFLCRSGGILCSATQNFHFNDCKQASEGILRTVTAAFSAHLVYVSMKKSYL